MNEVKDYRAIIRYGDIKNICAITGLTPYLLKTRLDKQDDETIEIVKTYYSKKLEAIKIQLNDYNES